MPALNESGKGNEFVIEVRGLVKSYGRIRALREIDFKVNRGEFVAVFGPNGAGKTTLIRILSSAIRPTSGNVRISGFEVRSPKARSTVGVVSHRPFLYRNLTAEENLSFYGKLYGMDNLHRRVEHLLKAVGIYERAKDPVKILSRGMIRRVSLARALISDPDILLLDEPYSGLDIEGVNSFNNLLEGLCKEDRTVLMTTHNLSLGAKFYDRMVILSSGRILCDLDAKGLGHGDLERIYLEHVGGNFEEKI